MPGMAVTLQTELAARHDLMNVPDSGNAEFYDDTVKAAGFNVDLSHVFDTGATKYNFTLNPPYFQMF